MIFYGFLNTRRCPTRRLAGAVYASHGGSVSCNSAHAPKQSRGLTRASSRLRSSTVANAMPKPRVSLRPNAVGVPASPLSADAPPQVRVECEEVAAQDAAGRLGDGGGPAGLRGDGDADGSYEHHRPLCRLL